MEVCMFNSTKPAKKWTKKNLHKMVDTTAKNKFYINCYICAMTTISISIYLIFRSNVENLQLQGIYWFAIAAVFFMLPSMAPIIDRISRINIKGTVIELKERVEKLEEKSDLLSKFYQFLYNEDKLVIIGENLKNDISHAQQNALDAILVTLIQFRENTVYQLLKPKNNDEINSYRAKFEKLIPILEILIQAENSDPDKIHMYHAELAYVFKDSQNPQWEKAYYHINKAIELRNKLIAGNLKFPRYDFNRLICGLHVPEICPPEQLEKDFATVYNDSIKWMLFATHELLAPGLQDWILKNKRNEIETWKKEEENKSKAASKSPHESERASESF